MAPVSFSTVTPTNTMLSPCRVTYKGVDLGGTLGNVKIGYETTKAEIKADQLGEGAIDRVISKQTMTVEFEIAEVRYKDNWKVVFPHMHLVTSGGNKQIYSDSQIGRRDQDDAGIMILHPLALADADYSGDHKFFKMISDGASEIVYGPGEQAKLKFKGIVLPDFTVSPVRYYLHGDPSIGLVSASVDAPVLSGAGNGTMTGVTVYNNYTVTETITATCVTEATDSGTFYVAGSVTGPLGLATVGASFSTDYIAFTINDGSNDFEAGDVFTLHTVGANYV
jgi:hypothetical protein